MGCSWHFLQNTQGAPPRQLARTCQFSNQGELLSSKSIESACSLPCHQYTHPKCFFPPKLVSLTSHKQYPIVLWITCSNNHIRAPSPALGARCWAVICCKLAAGPDHLVTAASWAEHGTWPPRWGLWRAARGAGPRAGGRRASPRRWSAGTASWPRTGQTPSIQR